MVFGLSSSLPTLVGGGGGLVCESFDKADMLSNHFDGKQSRESVDLPLTCHPSQRLTTFAFGRVISGVYCLTWTLMGASTHLVCFLFFLENCRSSGPPSQCSFPACGNRLMSPLFRRVHRNPLLPTTDRFPEHQYCLRCLSIWCRFDSDDLWNAMVCFESPSLCGA